MDIVWEFLENLFFGWRLTSPVENPPRQWISGRRRSIVRIIGSLLPFPTPKRVHLDLAVWRNDHDYQQFPVEINLSHPDSNSESIDEGLESASTLFKNDARLQENADMRKLMEEIWELKMTMKEILERQKSATSCCDSVHCSSGACTAKPNNSVTATHAPTIPPPPPPPPPPLPLMLSPPVISSTPVGPKARKRNSENLQSPKPVGLGAVLKELKSNKIHLKPIARSPGGRPVKSHSSDADTPGSNRGDSLADILRKRYIKSEPTDSDRQ